MSSYDSLSSKIAKRDITCGVVGLGYVGLPLAVEMGKAGLRVIGFEVSPRIVESVNAGESHIKDVSAADVRALRASGKLDATLGRVRAAGAKG